MISRKLQDGTTDISDIRLTDNLVYALREEINELIEINDTPFQLMEAIKSIIEFGCFVVSFSDDYKYFSVFKLDEITVEELKPSEDNPINLEFGMFNRVNSEKLEEKVESSLFTSIVELYKERKIKVRLKTGEELNPDKTYIISNTPTSVFGKSKLEKIYKYTRILYIFEIANMLERLAKSKLLNLFIFDVSDLEDQDAAAYAALYSNIIKNKAAVNISEDEGS